MNSWRPAHPKFTWLATAMLALTGVLPFVAGVLAVGMRSPQSGSINSGIATSILLSTFFTIKQACLSTLVVGLFSPMFAVALLFFPPKMLRASIMLRTLIFCLPSLVVASGLISAWGGNGFATRLLESMGVYLPVSEIIYSRYAVVLANSLMNLPFASIILFRCLIEIPGEQIDSATLIGLGRRATFRNILWPAIKPVLIYYCGMTFLLSLGSFGALSILGGGPSSQTLELGIFQSIYFDGDWPAAALYATAHTALAGCIALLFIGPQYRWLDGFLLQRVPARLCLDKLRDLILPQSSTQSSTRWIIIIAGFMLDICIFIPLGALAAGTIHYLDSGLLPFTTLLAPLMDALTVSIGLAAPATIIGTGTAWLVTRSYCRYKLNQHSKQALTLLLSALAAGIIPSMATAFGLLAMRSVLPNEFFGAPAIVAVHATIILPFLINILLPIYSRKIMPFENSRILLGLSNHIWLKQLEWKTMRKGLGTSLAVGFALSINETSVVSMLADPLHPPLTTTMIRLMGHYRFGESSMGSCLLVITTTIAIILLSPRGGLLNDAA